MRERITYVVRDPSADWGGKIEMAERRFAVAGLEAAKEHQMTFGFRDLPSEIWRVLQNCHEFHLRFASSRPYESIAPFSARVPPGLHISFTPLEGKKGKRLCSLIKDAFGNSLKCDSVEKAFTEPFEPSPYPSITNPRQYYQYVPSIQSFVNYVQGKLCAESDIQCKLRAEDLRSADYFDADYDSVSSSLRIAAFWSKAKENNGAWYETPVKGAKDGDSLEIGVLVNEAPEEEEELKYSGVLAKVGEVDEPSPTLFSFATRHHPLPLSIHTLTFKTDLPPPTGLHPTLTLSFSRPATPPLPSCTFHTYFTLPSTLFLDPYPLSDPLFRSAHNLTSLRSHRGALDLEAPEWAIKAWGSSILLTLPPSIDSLTIPLHLRYLPPANRSHSAVAMPAPAVFFACPVPGAGTGAKFAASPFDRRDLGYDSLFPGHVRFVHVPPATDASVVGIVPVPVLDLRWASVVEWSTVGVAVLAWAWLVGVLFRAVWGRGVERMGKGKGKRE